jgi:hypothetical protein
MARNPYLGSIGPKFDPTLSTCRKPTDRAKHAQKADNRCRGGRGKEVLYTTPKAELNLNAVSR